MACSPSEVRRTAADTVSNRVEQGHHILGKTLRQLRTCGIALVLLASLAACSGEPDLAACKEALKASTARAMADNEQATTPKACDGVSDAELKRLAHEVSNER